MRIVWKFVEKAIQNLIDLMQDMSEFIDANRTNTT